MYNTDTMYYSCPKCLSTVAASELKRKKKKCKVRESKQKQNWGSKWYDHVKLKQEALG